MAGLWDGKQIRLQELHRFPNGPVRMGGTLRWDVVGLWSEIEQGLGIAARRFGKAVRSVGVDTWGVDFVLLSKSNELLGLPFHYRDERTRGVMKRAFREVPRTKIFEATGLQFMELNTLYQLLALHKQSPEVLDSADRLLMMPDFFHWCLSGARVAEFTDATTTQFLDPREGDWSRSLLRRFRLPTHMLPEIVPPGTRLGPLLKSLARNTGLNKVDVIAPATHDTGSAVVAVPTQHVSEGTWAYLSSGTWSLMGLEVSRAQLSRQVLRFNLTNEGGVDGTYRLLKNIAGLWLVQQCKRVFESSGRTLEYGELVRLANKEAPLRSLIDPDHEDFMNPRSMPEAIKKFCRQTGQPAPGTMGAVTRCILESLASKYRMVLERLEEVGGRRVEVIHVVGGGSRNDLLNQFTADACQRPVIAGPVEATVLGNVLVQARACKQVSSLAEIRAVVRSSCEMRMFEPKRENYSRWEAARLRFNKLSSQG